MDLRELINAAGIPQNAVAGKAIKTEKKTEKVKISFTESSVLPCEKPVLLEQRKAEVITISISELLECAKEKQHNDIYAK